MAISLDIAKAFDRVWHKALLSKLPAYGLPSRLCTWIAGFLRERRIHVVSDGCASRFMPLNAGVPQGSVLSPTLFLLHINDMLLLGNIHCYAGTVHGRYLGRPNAGRAVTDEQREFLVNELNRV
jgi:retron-type reverse transcriptase